MGNATADQAKGTEIRVTTDESTQRSPSIYENKIVWTDWRNGNWDIYMYDFLAKKETQITTNTSDQLNPVIYGDIIVWEDGRHGGTFNGYPIGNWDIYMYDLSTKKETQITNNESCQDSPVIYENKIVWQDTRSDKNKGSNYVPIHDIYMYDISTHKETQITANQSQQITPAIYKDRIVWADNRNGNWDIYMYNMSTAEERQIMTTESEQADSANQGYQLNPAIFNDIIVYEVGLSTAVDNYFDLYVYNLATSRENRITYAGINHEHPAIYGDNIVWRDYRNTEYPYGGGDIYTYNTPTAKESQITINKSAEEAPVIYKNKIVWTDWRNGNGDIYMFILDQDEPVIYPPVANFTATPLSGQAPLKVKFTSTSTGSPAEWKWNFGDGSPLVMEQNPEHTYSKAGIYTVKHTAINAIGRDTEIKTKYVTVTSPALPVKAPVAAFSAAPRSGKAPLKVKFTDKSTGSPTSWKWNFGDGKYSVVKSPEHTYSKAGKYNVTLTVKNAKGSSTKTISKYIAAAKK
ncbi:MAG: PKD domain-containing protein [Methanosarcina sp.]